MANKIDFKIGPGIGISAHSLYIVSTSDGGYNSGAVRIAGGASIGRTLSLSGSLLLQNGANYTGLKSSASSNTIYTLPNQYPATGTSVLQSDTTGQMTWVPMVASVGGGSGSGTVDYGLQYRLATYPSAGTLVTNSDITYNPFTTKLSFSNLTFVGNGNSAISISGVGNGGQILTTWDTLNSGLSLDASNASLRIVGDTNAGTTLVDLGVYDNSGFPTGNWNSKYLFPKTTNAIFVNGLSITNSTVSTSTSTGALVITGGVGIGGSLFLTSSLPSSLSGVVVSNGVVTSGSWAGSLITGIYGGTGFNSYTKGDILVGAGNTFIKLPVGTNNYVLTASSSTATGLTWSPTASTGITTLNGLTDTIQYFSIGYSGNVPSFSSSGSTHTLNIPIAGTGSTGLVSTQTQSFAGSKTFTNAVSITDNTGSGSYTSGALIVTGGVGIGGTLNVQGDLNVQGTFTTINSTTLTVADKNIEMGSVGTPSDLTAQGGGITLKGATDKSINWYSGVGWSSSENFNIASGNVYKINNVEVLSSTRLNTGVIFSSIQTAGIITSGTWAATAITTNYGGTGFSSFTNGDILAGAGTTLIKVAIGSNNFVLTADNTVPGGVKWAAAVSSGSAITAQNINVSAATTNATHYIIFSPSITGSGVALSTEPALVYNPSTDILSASGIAITSSTASGSTSTGALTVVGGVGIGQSLSIDGRIQFFNGANYTAFVSAATANTVYILPATSPATGSSVLQSTSTGILSWVPLVASASGTTAQNIVVNSAGSADVFHPLLFTPSQITSGSAVSSDSLLSYNANSDRLFVSGIFVTSGTASTSTFTGGLLVAGGIGVSGQISFTRASLGFTGVTGTPSMAFIGATTSSYISLNVLSDNSLSFEGSSGQLFSIDNNLTTGEIFSVSDISGLPVISASAGQTVTLNEFGGVTKIGDGTANATSTTNAALVVSGGLGITGNAFIGGTATVTNTTISSSTSTGALVVAGGVGIGGSLYTSSSNANSISGVVLSNSVVRTGTWAATAITSFYGGTGHSNYTAGDLLVGAGGTLAKLAAGASNYVLTSNGAGTVPSWQAVPPSAASSVAVTTSALDQSFFVTFVSVANGSGLGLTTSTSFVINPSSGLVTASGLALTNLTNATSTSSGALRVSGGLGLTGNAFIGGTINAPSTNQSNISNVYFTNGNVTGTSVTATTIQGTLVGTATTATNSHLATTGNAVGPFYLAMSASSTGSGVALSTDTSLSYNSSSDVLTVPYVSGTAITATTSFSGQLFGNVTGTATTATNVNVAATGNVEGPFYIIMSPRNTGSGVALSSDSSLQYNTATDVLTVPYISGTAITASTSFSGSLFGDVTGTATTATYSHQSGYGITAGIATTARNINVANATTNTPHTIYFGSVATGSGVAVSSNQTISFNPSSFILSTSGLAVTATTASTNSSSGALVVTGGVGIGDSLFVAGNLIVNTGTNGLVFRKLVSGNYGAIYSTNITPSATNYSMITDGASVNFNGTNGVYFNINNTNKIQVTTSNINIVPTTDSTSTSTGAFTVSGGVGIGGSLYVASATGISGVSINNGVVIGNLTGTATTGTNVHLASTGNVAGPFYLTMSASSSGSGIALSSDTSLSYNSASDVLTVSYISGTAITASTSFSGQLFGNVTGTATTSRNSFVNAATTSSDHYLIFSPNASGSGLALSSGANLVFNPSQNVLSVGTGIFAANGISVGAATNTITTASGSLNLDSVSGQTNINDNVVIQGNLTVQGTTLTVDSTVSTFVDPVVVLGSGVGGTHSTLDNNQDRGIEFRWSNSGTATTGFFGFNDNDGKFRFIPNASISSSNVYTGTAGTAVFGTVEAILSGNSSGTASTYTNFYGSLTGTASTSTNVHLASTGNAVGPFYLALSSGSSGAGLALSTDTALAYNSASDVLTVSYISGTAITASTSFSGQLFGNVTGTATTSTYSHQSGYGITAGTATTAANVHLAVGANAVNHSVIFSPSATGSGIALSTDSTLLYNPNTDTLTSTNFAGNLTGNVTGTATTSANIHLASTGNVAGPFYLTMSSGASGSGIALSSDSSLSYNSATDVLTVSNISGSAITASTSFAGPLFGDVTGFATTARNVNVSNAVTNSAHTIYFGPSATGSGVALSSNRTISFNPSSFILSTSGLAVTATTVSTNSTSGALVVSGGVGIGGTLNIDGNVKINFTNHTAFNVSDVFTVYPVNNFEGANIKSNYSYAFNVQDKSNNNRFTVDVGNNKTILSGNTFSHELRIYNANQVGYTGFVAASSGTVTYTLPAGDGSANFLLTTNGSGVLSWSNISGLAVTNINGLTSSYQYLAFDYSGSFPSWSSSGATHTLNIPLAGTASTGLVSNLAQSFAGIKTFTNDVFVSSATASTWAANGALRVQGGLGVSGQISFNQAALGYTGATNPSIAFIGGTTGSPITLSVLSDNSLIFEGTSGKLFGINNNLSTGWIFNVGDISGLPLLRANADGNVTMAEYAGNVGIGLSNPAYKLHVTGSVGFTSSVGSTNTTTGALIVSGGVGIGQSISIGGRIQFFNGANFTAFVSSATGNTVYTLPATSPATGSSVLSSTSTGVMSWVPMAAIASTVNAGTANNAAYYATSSATISENSNLQFTGTGLSVGGNINSSSTRSGSLYVNGGFGITGNAFIGGTVNITNTTSATGVSTAALVVSGGLGVNGDVYVANSAGSKLAIMQSAGDEGGEIFLNKPSTNTSITTGVTVDIYQNKIRFFEQGGTNRGFYLDITSGGNSAGTNIMGGASSGTVNSGTATYAAFYAGSSNAVSENANLQFTGTGVSVGGNINSSSTRSGSLYVSGGFGVTGNAFIGGTTTIQSNTASVSTTSGALVVSGGVGIGGSLNVLGEVRVGTDTFTKIYSGDINFDNGTVDTPGNRFYWRNNHNFGIDAYSSAGTGITKFRVVKEMGESGGAELFSIDRDGTVYYHNPPIGSTVGLRHTGSGTTIYTLPATSPAIGTSYLVSDSTGVMSWIRPKRSYVLSFGAGFTPSANAADTVQINIPYAPDNVALNYLVKRIEFRNETVSGGTGLSFYLQRHTAGNATWTTANRIQAGSGASFEVGAAVYQASFTIINSSSGTNGLVASGDYVRLFFTTVGSAANVSISMIIEEQ